MKSRFEEPNLLVTLVSPIKQTYEYQSLHQHLKLPKTSSITSMYVLLMYM